MSPSHPAVPGSDAVPGPGGIGTAAEAALQGPVPALAREDWLSSRPGVVHGITTRGDREARGGEADFRLFDPDPAPGALARWEGLAARLGMARLVHARQVHGAAVRVHTGGSPGLELAPPCDGHVTREEGVLLAVTVADCVPVFLLSAAARVVGLLHAGWRGVAAGILEEGIAVLEDRFAVTSDRIEVHLGPSISGDRYEVGPEVHSALGLEDPGGPAPLDLRAVLAARARALGVPGERIRASAYCTRSDARFFSHRGGDRGRQVAFLGLRPGGWG